MFPFSLYMSFTRPTADSDCLQNKRCCLLVRHLKPCGCPSAYCLLSTATTLQEHKEAQQTHRAFIFLHASYRFLQTAIPSPYCFLPKFYWCFKAQFFCNFPSEASFELMSYHLLTWSDHSLLWIAMALSRALILTTIAITVLLYLVTHVNLP